MQQAIHRLRWQVDHRNLHINKPLPVLNSTTAELRSGKPTRTSNKSSKSSPKPLQSPIPTISVDTSALHVHPPHSAQRNAQLLSPSSASSSRRHSSFSPVSNSNPSPSTGTRDRPHRRQRIPTQAVIAVMDFLEQQEREMHVEVQRVSAEIRELRRCVRAVKRERVNITGAGRRETPGMGMESSWSGSGSDADTEEVSVVVISAD